MEPGRLADLLEGVAGWEGPVPGLDRVGIVSALIVVPEFLIKGGLLAITLTALSVAQRW